MAIGKSTKKMEVFFAGKINGDFPNTLGPLGALGSPLPRFHDVHHAFPNAVGTLSQRGRFHGWEKVHDASAEVLHRGLWKPNGDEESPRRGDCLALDLP